MEKPGTKKEIEIKKCSHMGCHNDAIHEGTVTKEDIKNITEDRQNIKHLFQTGTWYYCEEHKKIVGAYCPHMKFKRIVKIEVE